MPGIELYSCLLQAFKEKLPQVSKEKLVWLNGILDKISTDLANPKPPPKPAHFYLEATDSNMPQNANVCTFTPPFTPTTVVTPVSPMTFSPDSHFTATDLRSIDLSYISKTSMSLSPTPPASSHSTLRHISTFPCTPVGVQGKMGSRYQSTDNFVLFGDVSSPTANDILTPSVRSLSGSRTDERQVNQDWQKILDAANLAAEKNSIDLVNFNNDSNENIFPCGNQNMKFEHYSATPTSTYSSYPDRIHRTMPGPVVNKPLVFNNPSYRGSNSNVGSGVVESYTVAAGSTVLGSQDSLTKRHRPQTPPGIREGENRLRAIPDASFNRINQCFKASSSDSLNSRQGSDAVHKPGSLKSLQASHPLSGSAPRVNWMDTTATRKEPLSKSTEFYSRSESPSSTEMKRTATDSVIAMRVLGREAMPMKRAPATQNYRQTIWYDSVGYNTSGRYEDARARNGQANNSVGQGNATASNTFNQFSSLPPQGAKIKQIPSTHTSPRLQVRFLMDFYINK